MKRTPGFRVDANISVPAADGVRLATDVYRPSGDGAGPVVLLRTPYGKGGHVDEGLGWARHGIAFVVQDVRGRYDSEGVWDPYTLEREDGAAAIAWLAEQPWCDGRIVLTGGSYAAFAAFAGALGGHPAIRGVISLVPAMGTHATAFTDSGVLNLGDHLWWWATFAEGRSERRRLVEVMLQTDSSILRHLPLFEAQDRLWIRLEHWIRPLLWPESHVPAYAVTEAELRGLGVPVLHVGGWHDPFIRQTLHHYAVAGMDHTPRPEQGLIVGPWTHTMEFNTGAKIGEREYGPGSALPLGNNMVSWVRHILGDAPPAFRRAGAEEPRVRLFTGGQEPWLNTMTWPDGRVRTELWHACADGQLAPQSSQDTGVLSFCYDPLDPFPSRSQPVDQRDLLERPDAVRFVSPPLPAPLSWLGTPTVTLTAATDGRGTDWVARLLEVLPDGRALYLGHGIVDAAREMARQGQGLRPGEPHRVTIHLPPGAGIIGAGHRLCLEITSSCFPEHARNLNTGENRYTTAETRIAHQTVYCGLGKDTMLALPILSEGSSAA